VRGRDLDFTLLYFLSMCLGREVRDGKSSLIVGLNKLLGIAGDCNVSLLPQFMLCDFLVDEMVSSYE
jgi:hypothetical protein